MTILNSAILTLVRIVDEKCLLLFCTEATICSEIMQKHEICNKIIKHTKMASPTNYRPQRRRRRRSSKIGGGGVYKLTAAAERRGRRIALPRTWLSNDRERYY